jgi:hypothetical protein
MMDIKKAEAIAKYELMATWFRFFSEINPAPDFDLAVRNAFREAEIEIEKACVIGTAEYERAVNTAEMRAETLLRTWRGLTK